MARSGGGQWRKYGKAHTTSGTPSAGALQEDAGRERAEGP